MTRLGVRFKQSVTRPESRLHVPEITPAENSGGPATALADPPQPPNTPPGAVASGTPEPRRRHTGLIVAIVLSLLAIGLLALVVFVVLGARDGGSGANASATKASYESAMRKAGVTAAYPGRPVALTGVTPRGSHPFSATFSADEIAALFNTFPYESDVAGARIALRNIALALPGPGTAQLAASVTANGGTYSGAVTLPLAFSAGRITSTGATALTVEGINGSDGQRAQAGSALVGYFNAYLAAAPGLTIESASITADGVTVTGTAPDSLTLP